MYDSYFVIILIYILLIFYNRKFSSNDQLLSIKGKMKVKNFLSSMFLSNYLVIFTNNMNQKLKDLNDLVNNKIQSLENHITNLENKVDSSLNNINNNLSSINSINESNNKSLKDEINEIKGNVDSVNSILRSDINSMIISLKNDINKELKEIYDESNNKVESVNNSIRSDMESFITSIKEEMIPNIKTEFDKTNELTKEELIKKYDELSDIINKLNDKDNDDKEIKSYNNNRYDEDDILKISELVSKKIQSDIDMYETNFEDIIKKIKEDIIESIKRMK